MVVIVVEFDDCGGRRMKRGGGRGVAEVRLSEPKFMKRGAGITGVLYSQPL